MKYEKIEQAYAERKAQLIEAARLRRQQALENSLAKKSECVPAIILP